MPNVDKEQTHWDGCWFEHHECALARLEKFERTNEVIERENKELKQKYDFLYTENEKHVDLIIKIEDLISNIVSWEI